MVHTAADMDTCAVYFAGVNERDVLLANGVVKRDDLPEEFSDTDGVLGVEFSGRDSSGKRVMGLCAPPVGGVWGHMLLCLIKASCLIS